MIPDPTPLPLSQSWKQYSCLCLAVTPPRTSLISRAWESCKSLCSMPSHINFTLFWDILKLIALFLADSCFEFVCPFWFQHGHMRRGTTPCKASLAVTQSIITVPFSVSFPMPWTLGEAEAGTLPQEGKGEAGQQLQGFSVGMPELLELEYCLWVQSLQPELHNSAQASHLWSNKVQMWPISTCIF